MSVPLDRKVCALSTGKKAACARDIAARDGENRKVGSHIRNRNTDRCDCRRGPIHATYGAMGRKGNSPRDEYMPEMAYACEFPLFSCSLHHQEERVILWTEQ